jgi:hypothetical protein
MRGINRGTRKEAAIMKRKISKTKKFDDLRERAEKKSPGSTDSTLEMSPSEIQKLVNELHIHQMELEEALRKSEEKFVKTSTFPLTFWSSL